MKTVTSKLIDMKRIGFRIGLRWWLFCSRQILFGSGVVIWGRVQKGSDPGDPLVGSVTRMIPAEKSRADHLNQMNVFYDTKTRQFSQ